MKAELQQRKPEIDLVALYRRRKTILVLIRSMERYRRPPLRPIQRCKRLGREYQLHPTSPELRPLLSICLLTPVCRVSYQGLLPSHAETSCAGLW